ncbi:MAG: methyltransferase domain-containing protein [Candidatus Omnitrophica bacterium]|nr:methyltransferase domain-containing protein [Candidatus Omnitrophota bacterium]
MRFNKKTGFTAGYRKALEWIKTNTIEEKGIVVSSQQKFPYLEVTGYLVPTLMEAGEFDLAGQYAGFLVFMQRPNGSFAGPDGREYIFDSGQALRGLARAAGRREQFKPFAQKTADYLVASMHSDGRLPAIYNDDIPEAVHVFVLPALVEAGVILQRPDYIDAAHRSAAYYQRQSNVLSEGYLTHFLAYILDGFIDVGEVEFVRPFVEKLFFTQRKDGSIPAYAGVNWACSTGVAQLAIIAYKLGMYEQADKALKFVRSIQNPSGGFFGSYGSRADYFPKAEISWAAKFFIDAAHMSVKSFFDRHADIFLKEVPENDPRFKFVADRLMPFKTGKVLDAGCGKGRFSQRIHQHFPDWEIHGLDCSNELLKEAGEFIHKKQGSLLCLPYPDEYFEAVICIEALEHTIEYGKAIMEMCRVLKKDGILIIIDKNLKHAGAMDITDFEQWFDDQQVLSMIKKYCPDAQVESISLKGCPEGFFLGWSGTKGLVILDEQAWHGAITAGQTVEELAAKIKGNDFPVWCKPLLVHTAPDDVVLELGSGTGELAAICSLYGRQVQALDYSQESIDFVKALFQELGLTAQFYCQDILKGIQLPSSSVDWVFSSGVLEHFSDHQIIAILKDSKRLGRKGVMSLVPNAGALFYRIGKYKMEQEGTWAYGREVPKLTMRPLFEAAGLNDVREYSVGATHALQFWGSAHEDIKKFFGHLSMEEIHSLNQGYLLFTIGTVQ